MSPLVLLVVKIKKNREEKYMYQIKKNVIKKKTLFLSKVLIHLCMTILNIVEENIFAVIVYKLLVKRKY